MHNRIIIIGGPTASYKSELALLIASRFDSCVINADSMQIYKELPIISAQPSNDEKGKCQHYLYGHLDAESNYSVANWLNESINIIHHAHQQGKIPIIVGGTGLYIHALVKGLATIPLIENATKIYCQEQLATLGYEGVYKFLVNIDAQILQKIHHNDKQRILRAFEVYIQTNISIFEHHKQTKAPFYLEQFFYIVSNLNREDLYFRCDKRVEMMISLGAIDEVKNFSKQNLNHQSAIFNTIGVKPIQKFIAGELLLNEAVKLWQQETRNFAKRQTTWFKNQLIYLNKYNYMNHQDLDKISKNII